MANRSAASCVCQHRKQTNLYNGYAESGCWLSVTCRFHHPGEHVPHHLHHLPCTHTVWVWQNNSGLATSVWRPLVFLLLNCRDMVQYSWSTYCTVLDRFCNSFSHHNFCLMWTLKNDTVIMCCKYTETFYNSMIFMEWTEYSYPVQ